jgi:NADH-quinone oxidoreductase subunit N
LLGYDGVGAAGASSSNSERSMQVTALSLPVFLPEVVLGLGTLALVLYGALRGERTAPLVNEAAVTLIGVVFILLVARSRATGVTFYGAFADDKFTRFMGALTLIGSLVTLLLSAEFMRSERIGGFEFPILILISTLGMLMLISANDLIALYLGLELMSLSLYVIAAYRRHDLRATEAGLKYFVLGALSSGMLLYGASLIYGYAGSVSFAAIAEAVHDHRNIGELFGLVFVLAGLMFKISVVPFHMWTPDVYEGAPTPVTTLFASAPKVAAMAILIRLAVTAFPGVTGDWRQILTFVAIASMGLGAFAAIGQSNFKRLMAYSSIGHMGYALVGLAAGTVEGAQSVLVYMAIYVVMTLGTFAAILSMRRSGRAVETIADLAGLARTDSTMAFFLATMMFSLAGIPPLAGFFAKFYVFAAAIKAGLYGLAVIGVLASAVAAYYYLRIVKLMYFDEPAKAFDRSDPVARIVLAVSALLIILFVFAPSPLTDAAMAAAQSLF